MNILDRMRWSAIVVAVLPAGVARGAAEVSGTVAARESKTVVLGDEKGIAVRLTYLTEATPPGP